MVYVERAAYEDKYNLENNNKYRRATRLSDLNAVMKTGVDPPIVAAVVDENTQKNGSFRGLGVATVQLLQLAEMFNHCTLTIISHTRTYALF